ASSLECVPERAVPADVATRRVPTEHEWHDIRLGLSVARAVAALDAGQTVVLKRGVILAVEAAEGTDAAIRRGGGLAAGTVVVKAARPDQDPRFDLPTIGAQTVALLQDVGAAVLAVEAGKTLLLDRHEAVAVADQAGIVLVDVAAFNLRLAELLRGAFPVVYYFPPMVSVRRGNRAAKVARLRMRLLATLRREADAYRAVGADVEFVGHPAVDVVHPTMDVPAARRRFGVPVDGPIVGLMPGSRPQEIRAHLPVMLDAARALRAARPELWFLLPVPTE